MRTRTDVLDRPRVSCSIVCLYSLKEYVSVKMKSALESWTTRQVILSHLRHFFCTSGSFYFTFFVLSMVLRLDATENKPNVGHRRVY